MGVDAAPSSGALPVSAETRARPAKRAARRSAPIDALVLNASLRQAVVTLRSLGQRGLSVAAAGAEPRAPAFASRWCREMCLFPPEDSETPYLTALESCLERIGPQVLMTSHDATIALLRAHRNSLEGHVRLALAKEPALSIAVNKERTLAVARRLGLRTPEEAALRDSSEASAAVRDLGLPAVVKPSESWVSNGREGARLGCQLVVTPDEARRAVDAITRYGPDGARAAAPDGPT